MNLQEAIERLASPNLLFWKADWEKDKNAIKLGIEAMKVLRHGRLIGAHHDPILLPAETKEQERGY